MIQLMLQPRMLSLFVIIPIVAIYSLLFVHLLNDAVIPHIVVIEGHFAFPTLCI
jgi:hypothetical protein